MAVHPTALIASGAEVAKDAEIGPYTIVHANVRIAEGARIGSHCELGVPSALAEGRPLVIGEGALIRSHSVFYEGSRFGPGLVTGHRVTVREKTEAGSAFQIGTLSDIQGHCTIGDHVRTHSNVHIGQHSEVGNFVWIFPYVVLTNDPHPPSEVMKGVTVGDFAVIATMVTVLPGIVIGEGAVIGASSLVSKDVAAHRIVAGVPARDRGATSSIQLQDGSGRPAYPWTSHFQRGYPSELTEKWIAEATSFAQRHGAP